MWINKHHGCLNRAAGIFLVPLSCRVFVGVQNGGFPCLFLLPVRLWVVALLGFVVHGDGKPFSGGLGGLWDLGGLWGHHVVSSQEFVHAGSCLVVRVFFCVSPTQTMSLL